MQLQPQSPEFNLSAQLKQGIIFLVVAPSGAGKSSLVKSLLEQETTIDLSISYTTRAIRNGETNGKEYHFVNVEQFKTMQENNEFIEYALVHGNFYGTSRTWLEQELKQNKKILLEIDWQGANQVKALFDKIAHVVYIFILPPSIEELNNRLLNRGQDSVEVIQKRILGAKTELPHALDADYVIINQDFNLALEQLSLVTKQASLYAHIQYQQYKNLMQNLAINISQ